MRRNPLVNNYAFVAQGDADRNRQMMAQGVPGWNLSTDASEKMVPTQPTEEVNGQMGQAEVTLL